MPRGRHTRGIARVIGQVGSISVVLRGPRRAAAATAHRGETVHAARNLLRDGADAEHPQRGEVDGEQRHATFEDD